MKERFTVCGVIMSEGLEYVPVIYDCEQDLIVFQRAITGDMVEIEFPTQLKKVTEVVDTYALMQECDAANLMGQVLINDKVLAILTDETGEWRPIEEPFKALNQPIEISTFYEVDVDGLDEDSL